MTKITLDQRLEILEDIRNNFSQAVDCILSLPRAYYEHMEKATTLIKMLEVNDCGYDGENGQPSPEYQFYNKINYTLFDRFEYLCKKHNQRHKIRTDYRFTMDALRKYFIALYSLEQHTNYDLERAEKTLYLDVNDREHIRDGKRR